ncbi:hypothetical protein GCM10009804_51490 [Kribbella hippodromi]|uniref:Uncharacterized protein n=1 Tax=Kribbella hippodromi TaxID=434347 RepID=A0ABP4PTL3_9ACTN
MPAQTGRLVALVAAVAVAAITGGGALAYRQGPQTAQADAAPLSTTASTAQTPSPTPSPSASTPAAAAKRTPTVPPTSKPVATGPVKTAIDLKKLPPGRAPQVTYLSGRTIRGGAGEDIKVPGSTDIQDVARLGNTALAVVSQGAGNELLTIDSQSTVTRRTPGVTQIVTTADSTAAAYVGTQQKSTGEALPGAIVYAERDQAQGVQQVKVPGVWDTTLLSYVGGKVYFDASITQGGPSSLYEWTPGDPKVTQLKSVPRPTAVSSAGTAGSLTAQSDQSSCSNLLSVRSGKRLWRTCDYIITGFTPDGSTVIAGPKYQDGYADGITAALDAKNGGLLHEWSGVFRQTIPEDDQHLLLLADTGQDSPASIVRCTVSTGACELATPLAKGPLLIGS